MGLNFVPQGYASDPM